MTRILRRLVKWFYLSIALLLILFAVLVQSGRSFSYLVTDYKSSIAEYLSQQVGAKVQIGNLRADWKGLKPGLEITNLELQSTEGQKIASFNRAVLQLDILRSLRNLRLVWSDLQVNKVSVRFQQQADGFWKIPGLNYSSSPKNPEDVQTKGNIDPLIDMFLLSHHLSLKQSDLVFEFNDQKILTLTAPNLLLENKNDFHRLSLQVNIDKQERSLYLLMEAKGDPRQTKNLQAKAYLELNEFPTSEPLQAATAFLLSGQKSHLSSEGNLSAKIWMDSRGKGEGFNLTGQINLQRLLVEIQQRHLALDQFSVDLAGHWLRDGQWKMGLQNISAQLANEKLDHMNMVATSAGFKQAIFLRLDQLDLQKTHQLLNTAGILGQDKLFNSLQSLQPKGFLNQLQVTFPYQDAKNWQLAARVEQVSVSPWQGVPGLTSVDGYLQTGANSGFISIDSRNGFSMFYPAVYEQPMQYDRMSGQVAWLLEKEKNKVQVYSGALHFYQADEHTKGYMWLSLPWIKGTDNVDLYLQIGSKQLKASQYKKYTPKTLPPTLLSWLDNSIGDTNTGAVSNIGFVYRASLNIKEPYARSYQLQMDLDNAQLNYHPEWPALKNVSGDLRLDDAQVYANIKTAKVFDSNIEQAQVEMHPKVGGKGSMLSIKTQMQGSASDGLRVLREGALRRYLGNSMDSWFMFGNIQTQLDLVLPIGTGDAHGAYQQVDIAIDSPVFEMQNLNLQAKDIKGHVSYNNTKGISSENLQATLFNEPITVQLSSLRDKDQQKTRVQVQGNIDTTELTQWTRRPETQFLKGRMPYDLIVDLKHNNKTQEDNSAVKGMLQSSQDFMQDAFAEVRLTSNLHGVTVDLPKPYGKKASTKKPFNFQLWLQPLYTQIHASYDGKIDSLFRLQRGQEGRLINANIALAEEAQFKSDDGISASEFLVSGYLANFDLDAWKVTQQQYAQYQSDLRAEDAEVVENRPDEIAGLPFKANLNLGNYQLGAARFENINVIATRNYLGWHLQLDNPKIHGELMIPSDANSALGVNLNYLYLDTNSQTTAGEQTTAQQNFDPRKLPLANINIEQLFLDAENWGDIHFDLRPNQQGVLIDNIKGKIRGMSFHHATLPDAGAQLFWQITERGQQSRFTGRMTTTNMADVLRQWKKPEMVESQSAEFKLDVNWLSAPQDFQLVDMSGVIDLNLQEGRFHREASAGDGLLRLMSILNFDSIARRLRLDFTDLYKTGLAYDQISGKVSFDRGTMNFVEPLLVRSPSSDLQMAGSLNLRKQTINTRIVANLPVAGNLTFYAALATGLPAAAGVYLVSKLFKKQVNQFASVSYTMKGSWEKPKVKFDRLFESEDSLRKNAETEPQQDLSALLESRPNLQPTMEP